MKCYEKRAKKGSEIAPVKTERAPAGGPNRLFRQPEQPSGRAPHLTQCQKPEMSSLSMPPTR